MSGRMWLAVISLTLVGIGFLAPVVGGVNLALQRTHAAARVLALCFFVSAVAGIGAIVIGSAAGLGRSRSTEDGRVFAMARIATRVGVYLAVLGLLASIVIPNFLEAARPTYTTRAKAEIRNISLALEAYYRNQNHYPPAINENGKPMPYASDGSTVSAGYVPWMLTTPTAYIDEIPNDPFHRLEGRREGPYRYATNGSSCWIITSRGEDRDNDISIEDFPSVDGGNCSWRDFMSHFGIGDAVEYDATNGSRSSGDVVRVGP